MCVCCKICFLKIGKGQCQLILLKGQLAQIFTTKYPPTAYFPTSDHWNLTFRFDFVAYFNLKFNCLLREKYSRQTQHLCARLILCDLRDSDTDIICNHRRGWNMFPSLMLKYSFIACTVISMNILSHPGHLMVTQRQLDWIYKTSLHILCLLSSITRYIWLTI